MNPVRRLVGLIVAAVVLTAAMIGFAGTPASAKTTPRHVAIYVAGVGTACAPAGTNGLTALQSQYDVQLGQPGTPVVGMVLFINDHGSTRVKPNYWSYWHWSGGHWAYAGTGPGGYTPKAGSSDGWAFGPYQSTNQPPLPTPNYTSLCGGKDPTVPPAQPTKHSSTTHHQPAHTSTSTTTTRQSTGVRASQPARQTKSPAKPGTTTMSATPGASADAASARGSTPSAPGTTASIALVNALPPAPPKADKPSESGVPPWTTAIAIAFVLALGGGAFWRARTGRGR